MGSRGSRFGSGRVNMNDYDSVSREISRLGDRMTELVQNTNGYGQMTPSARREYYKVQGKRTELRDRLRTLRRPGSGSSGASGTYVNGYGEATHREITSTTYENAQRRLNRNVNRWFGRGM